MTLFSVVWLAAALVISSLAGEQTTTASNAWEPLKLFAGNWQGQERILKSIQRAASLERSKGAI